MFEPLFGGFLAMWCLCSFPWRWFEVSQFPCWIHRVLVHAQRLGLLGIDVWFWAVCQRLRSKILKGEEFFYFLGYVKKFWRFNILGSSGNFNIKFDFFLKNEKFDELCKCRCLMYQIYRLPPFVPKAIFFSNITQIRLIFECYPRVDTFGFLRQIWISVKVRFTFGYFSLISESIYL